MVEKITVAELADTIIEVASISGETYENVYEHYILWQYSEQHSLKKVLKYINKMKERKENTNEN